LLAFSPYFDATAGDAIGVPPLMIAGNVMALAGVSLTSGTDYYRPFVWACPMLVRRAWMRVATAYTGGTPVSNAYARIYALGSNGRPGKLLIDFGLIGTANASLNSTGNVSTGLASPGFMMMPGEYFFDFLPIFSGGTTPPAVGSFAAANNFALGKMGIASGTPILNAMATGGSAPAPDPASLTGYTPTTNVANSPGFTLAPS
jgi:hypothetical protein